MPSMFIGGAERSLLGLLDAFDYTRYEVNLFLYRHEGEFLSMIPESVHILSAMEEYATFDVPIKSLFLKRKWKYGLARVISKIAMRLHCVFSGEQPGVWMAMQYISKYLLALLPDIKGDYDVAISFLGVPDVLVNKVHAKTKIAWNHTDYTQLGPCKAYDKEVYDKLDYIVSVSEPCTNQFLKVYPEFREKAITLENILSVKVICEQADADIDEDIEFKCSETRILSVGRYSEAKNFDNIPCICRLIREKGLDIKWFIIGYGGDEELIRQRIIEENMKEYVILLGKRANPYPYIKKCDLYVQPSRYEGKAVTVREAQVLNKPVVITRFMTANSQLKDGIDGIIVPMDNISCANGITEILRNEFLRNTLIENTKSLDYSNKQEIHKLYALVGE